MNSKVIYQERFRNLLLFAYSTKRVSKRENYICAMFSFSFEFSVSLLSPYHE